MEKGKYSRKRRIDYSKEEIAKMLNVSLNTVDSRIDTFCKNYDFPKKLLKKDGSSGMNFFPPEYAPFLIELLKYDYENPSTPRGKDHKKVMSEDVVKYNKDLLTAIKENNEIAYYLKSYIQGLPFYRTAEDIVELTDILVLELEMIIHNILDSSNTDVGQGLRMIIRELDKANYNMFTGRQMQRMVAASNYALQQENEKGLMKELNEMSEIERQKALTNPVIKAIYDKYQHFRGAEEKRNIDDKDLSLDQGLVVVMKKLIQQSRVNLSNKEAANLSEYFDDELYNKLKMELDETTETSNAEEEMTRRERMSYLDDRREDIVEFLQSNLKPGEISFVIEGNKWKPLYQRIADGERDLGTEAAPQQNQYFDFKCFDDMYVKYCEEIARGDTKLREVVSNFIGRLMADYLFDSNKK